MSYAATTVTKKMKHLNLETAPLRPVDYEYASLLHHTLSSNQMRADRTNTGTRSLFGVHFTIDTAINGFPLLTTKKVHWPSVAHELVWFVKGSTNTAYLKENGVSIWDAWADENGELGPIYGKQWRNWEGTDGSHTDQLANVVHQLRTDPTSRRMMVSAWNPSDVPNMALPPCHTLFQFYVRFVPIYGEETERIKAELYNISKAKLRRLMDGDYDSAVTWREEERRLEALFSGSVTKDGPPSEFKQMLDMQVYQRSADVFLGLPFNIASYALLNHIVSRITGMSPGRLSFAIGDLHLYSNHVDQAREQFSRKPLDVEAHLDIDESVKELDDVEYSKLHLSDYKYHPAIKAPVAV